MTTIQSIPTWYRPAHILYLETVDTTSIKQFIAAIDHNPEPAYLNAIKFIQISELTDIQPLDSIAIRKVFCRFPNLTRVAVFDSLPIFATFDDKVCQTILNSCPNLTLFVPTNDRDAALYRTTVPRLRLILEVINVDKIDPITPLQLATDYTRLQGIFGLDYIFENFECWLPLVEVMPNLKIFRVHAMKHDRKDFLTTYLSSKTEEEQDIIVRRLSRINRLCYYGDKFCINSMAFLARYLTGLNSLTIDTDGRNWTDQQWEMCVDILECACSMKNDIMITLLPVELQSVLRYLPFIVDTVYHPIHPKKVLRIEIRKWNEPGMLMTMNVQKSELLQLTFTGAEDDLGALLRSSNITVDLYYFNLVIHKVGDIYMCHKVLKEMPLVKSVVLDMQNKFKEDEHLQDCGTRCEIVEDLTILTAAENYIFQPLLDYCSWTFPNLTTLYISMSDGAWKAQIGEYQLVLANYSLQKLELNVSAAITKMKEYPKNQPLVENNFFVIELNSLHDSERKLFKVAQDLSSATIIHDSHLRGLNRRKDYLRLNIIVEHLESLIVYGQQRLNIL